MMYRFLFTQILSRLDPEDIHHLTVRGLRVLSAAPVAKKVLHRRLAPRDPALRVQAFGVHFPGPFGLAAGFDKDAGCVEAMSALGFSHVEVGTITAHAQPGNARPRLFRLVKDRAVINRMGFNNAGADAAARTLSRTRGVPAIVGINIGKTKVVPESEAVHDYVASAKRLAPLADYLVVNVSSPNTPGLRNLQAVELLRPLLQAVKEVADGTRSAPRCSSRSLPIWRTRTWTRSPTSPWSSGSTASSRPTPRSAARASPATRPAACRGAR
nr:hypothetical protein GCM10020093_067930 [Planobispora longispora]